MIKKLFLLTMLGSMLTGCFMAPIAFLGPATSGFSTASIIQSGVTSGASYIVKKSTGKTLSEHAFDTVSREILKQTYFPTMKNHTLKAFPYSIKASQYSINCPHNS